MVVTAYLRGETVHERVEILVENGRVQPVEQIVAFLLALHEQLEVLVHSLLHCHRVVIPTGIQCSQNIGITFFSRYNSAKWASLFGGCFYLK